LSLISVILLIDSALNPASGTAALRAFIGMLSLSSLGITAYLSLRRTRALGRLLGRQADRLNATLRRRSDQERRTTEILNGVDTGIARLSTDGTLLTVNDTYSRLYGLDPQHPSLPARSVEYTSFQGMPIPISQRPFARAGRGEMFTDASVWLFTPEGEWRALSITAKRLRGTVDEEPSMLLVVQDVTAITQAQRERDQLTAMASHELKHPLTVMIGNAELALELDELTPRTRQRFQTILSASERMLEMTNNMLAVSRGELSSSHDAKEIDLRPILLDSVASFQPTAMSNEVQLEARIDERLPVAADGFRLRQAVDNLVSNAIKYTPRDGQVRVVAEADRESITLTIADTGIGIAENDLRNIMTPYFRTAAAKETAGGTGLGLGITNEIVAAHGGTLTMESAPGVGTTVAVRLPRAREDARAGAERHS
ncbi:MAG TPA: PAS domain-containing sensor histidine kinase, partial [Agromyces sp.]